MFDQIRRTWKRQWVAQSGFAKKIKIVSMRSPMLSVQSPPISSITKISPFLIPELISEIPQIPARTFPPLYYEIKTKLVRVLIVKKSNNFLTIATTVIWNKFYQYFFL